MSPVTNGQVTKGNLDNARCGALGEYPVIWKIRKHTFELGSVQIIRMHHILDRIEIVITNFVPIMIK